MPEPCPECARRKARDAERASRYRANKRHAAPSREPSPQEAVRHVTVTAQGISLSLETKTEEEWGYAAIGETLAPFASRGYVHDVDFWRLLAQEYPGVNLQLQAKKIAGWLAQPKNARRRCSAAFLDNWMKKAAADRTAPAPPPASRPPATVRGMVLPNGAYAPPASWQRVPDPPGLVHLAEPLAQIRLEDMPRVPLAERLAQMKGQRT